MRTIGILAGAVALTAMTPAVAQAPVGAPTQPGAWGQNGWQAGAALPPVTAAPVSPVPGAVVPAAPAMAAAAPAPAAPPMPDAPPGQHRLMTPGSKVPKEWRDQRYALADWPAYGFGQPGPGMRWMRYYDDAALIDERGHVIDVHHDVNWDARRAPGYGPGYGYAGGPPPYAPPMPVLPRPGTVRTGPNTTVTTSVVQVASPAYAGGAYYGAPILASTPGYVITTTTRTTTWRPVKRHSTRSKYARR